MATKQETTTGWMLPVGTVLPFTGIDPDGLVPRGWLVCNGFAVPRADYPELYAVLGDVYGSGEGTFALPDLRGTFLRGRDAGSARDPGVDARTPQGNGTARGDMIGSRQGFATGRPAEPFEVSVSHLPIDHHRGNVGSLVGKMYATWNDGTEALTMTGGDKESRPRNRYVHWIIKARPALADGRTVAVPLGAVFAFGSIWADELAAQWLPCNGNAFSNLGVYKSLYAVIKTAHGGLGSPMFNVPDYCGTFLRGVDGGAGVDPNAADRRAPHDGGNTGDAVGSIQGFATASPRGADKEFKVGAPHLPTGEKKVDNIAGRDTARSTDTKTTLNVSAAGGDPESRPVNAYVDWYLRFRATETEPETPVGVVVAYAGNQQPPDDTYWVRCEGQALDVNNAHYRALFAVLAFTHGGSMQSGLFMLPDYRGRFLRGTDYGAGQDPQAKDRTAAAEGGDWGDTVGSVQKWATGRPVEHFSAAFKGLPDTSNDVAATAVGTSLSAHNGGSVALRAATSGGDPETRPVNVYVDYYIKFAMSTGAAS